MTDYSMYKFYKGEKKNPFNSAIESDYSRFWEAEYVFELDFKEKETSDWFAFFSDHDMDKEFMSLLSSEDYDMISDKSKKPVFKLWLKYLFKYKLYPEYGGENDQEIRYNAY